MEVSANVTANGYSGEELARLQARVTALEEANAVSQQNLAEVVQANKQLEAILQAVPTGITVQDRTGRLIYANNVAGQLCGYASGQAMLAASGPEILANFDLLDEAGQLLAPDQLPGRQLLQGL